jgi:hypothetical protein
MSQQEVENQIDLLMIKKDDDGIESVSLKNNKNGVFFFYFLRKLKKKTDLIWHALYYVTSCISANLSKNNR